MFSRTITPKQLDELLDKYGAGVYDAMRNAGLAWAMLASRYAVRTKLSGQALNRVTGTLQRSVAASPQAILESDRVIASFGTNLDYGIAHEQGFQGTVPVRAHERLGHPVRAHDRMVNIRARWYLRDSGDETSPQMEKIVEMASDALLKDGKPLPAGALFSKGAA